MILFVQVVINGMKTPLNKVAFIIISALTM